MIFVLLAGIGVRCFIFKKDETAYHDIVSPGVVQHVITLVHGTWPRGPVKWVRDIEWYREGSLLCSSLLADGAIRHEGVLIHRFRWSGANTIVARHSSAHALRRELFQLIKKYPDARHGVISHSHGASVALKAVCHPSLAKRISKIVCLSSPFVRITKRLLTKDEDLGFLAFCLIGVLLALPPGLILWLEAETSTGFLRTVAPNWVSPFLDLLFPLSVILAGAALLVLSPSRSRFLDRRIEALIRRAGSYAKWNESVELQPQQLLIMRSRADEATMSLFASQLYGWIVLGVLERLCVLALSTTVFMAILTKFLPRVVRVGQINPLPINPGALFAGVMLITGLLALLCLLGRMLLALPFGVGMSPLAVFLKISVEAAPPGTCTLKHLDCASVVGMAHSALYHDRDAVAEISRWLELAQKDKP